MNASGKGTLGKGKLGKGVLCLSLLTAALLAACGGGGTPTPTVARIELNSASLVLEQGRAGQKLLATAYDAQGNVVNTPISFSSSNPGVVEIAPDGTASAKTVGSAQIVAQAGGVSSAPGIAASGVLADAVVHIPDEKVVSGPVFANGVTPFSVGSTYTVVLKDVSPTAGKLWFSKAPNGMTVQGKVMSSQPVAGGTEVTLEIVPYTEIFKQLQVNEEVVIPSQDVEFTAQTLAAFNVKPLGAGNFEFTPKANAAASAQGLGALAFNAGPFRCSGTLPDAAFNLGTTTFTLNTGNPTFNVVLDLPLFGTKRFKMLFTATPTLRVTSGTHTLTANFNNQSITCKLRDAVEAPFETFGLGFVAKMRPGVTLGGSFGSGTRSFSVLGSAAANVRLGFDCNTDSGCTSLSRGNTGTVNGALTMSSSGDLVRTARDLEVGAFLDTTISASVVVTDLDIISFTDGYKASLDLASLPTQVSSNNGAGYKVGEYVVVDPFASIKDLVKTLIGMDVAGLPNINVDGRSVQSPEIASAALNATKTGVNVALNPDRINFFTVVSPFSLGYNVKQVQLLQKNADGTVSVLGSVTPASGATSVNLSVPASADKTNLYVTVIPNVLGFMPVGTLKVR